MKKNKTDYLVICPVLMSENAKHSTLLKLKAGFLLPPLILHTPHTRLHCWFKLSV